MKATLIKRGTDDYRLYVNEVPFATTDNSPYKKLSKQNCDEIFGVVDVEKLAKEDADLRFSEQGQEDSWLARNTGIVWGFNKAMEFNKDKLFTIPQVIELCKKYYKFGIAETKFSLEKRSATSAEIIEDLKTLQPTEIEVEIEMRPASLVYKTDELLPKLDSEGCLILKKLL